MIADDEVLAIISHTVKTSRAFVVKDVPERILFSSAARPVEEGTRWAPLVRAADPQTGEQVILVPDPEEMLEFRCVGCERRLFRARWKIEKMNREYGFPFCRIGCRDEKIREKERIFVPSRGEAETGG